jgi:hypothetical protein
MRDVAARLLVVLLAATGACVHGSRDALSPCTYVGLRWHATTGALPPARSCEALAQLRQSPWLGACAPSYGTITKCVEWARAVRGCPGADADVMSWRVPPGEWGRADSGTWHPFDTPFTLSDDSTTLVYTARGGCGSGELADLLRRGPSCNGESVNRWVVEQRDLVAALEDEEVASAASLDLVHLSAAGCGRGGGGDVGEPCVRRGTVRGEGAASAVNVSVTVRISSELRWRPAAEYTRVSGCVVDGDPRALARGGAAAVVLSVTRPWGAVTHEILTYVCIFALVLGPMLLAGCCVFYCAWRVWVLCRSAGTRPRTE